MNRHGFSLVELSIVLVILGLLTGGILAGQSLIRASELRAVTTEYQRYFTAGKTFRDKYFAIPGDFTQATRVWGRLNAGGDCVTNSATAVASPGTCDGNGSGLVESAAAANESGERFQLWRQLANAGLIEGTYTGIAGTTDGTHHTLGVSAPRSKLSNAGWTAFNNSVGNTQIYAMDYGNFLLFGAMGTLTTSAPVLKPEEAWNIDMKMDDGMPGRGQVIARYWDNLCANSTSNTDYAGTYRLTDSAAQCALFFRNAF